MKVSVRLNHGFWTLGMICALALGFQSQTFGQIVSAVNENGSQARPVEQQPVDNVQSAARALYKARTSLAVGDLDLAKQMVELAKSQNVDFAALGDAPSNIESMIGYHQDLAALQQRKDPAYEKMAASFLLQQANMILAYRDFETAEMLAQQASRFNADFAGQALSPQSVMNRIAQVRGLNSGGNNVAAQTVQPQHRTDQLAKLMAQAKYAFDSGDLPSAQAFVAQAKQLNIPESQLAAGDMKPWQLELKIQEAMRVGGGSQVMPASFHKVEDNAVVQADYYPETDTTRNVTVAGATPDGEDRLARHPEFNPIPSRGMQLYRSGLKALQARDKDGAREYFQMAWQYREQLDRTTQQTIQDHLGNLTRTAQATLQQESPFEEESFSPFNEEEAAPAENFQQGSPFDEEEDFSSSFQPESQPPSTEQRPPAPVQQPNAFQGTSPAVQQPIQPRNVQQPPVTQPTPVEQVAPRQPVRDFSDRNATPNTLPKRMDDPSEFLRQDLRQGSSDPLTMVEKEDRERFDKLQREVFRERAAAQRLQDKSPRESLEKLSRLRNRVAQSDLREADMRPLLTIIDRQLTETQDFIDQNLTRIVGDEKNAANLEAVQLDRQRRYDIEQQVQALVQDFNKLLDEQRYHEADAIARQASALDPRSEISTLMREKARIALRTYEMEIVQGEKEESNYRTWYNNEKDMVLIDEEKPYQFTRNIEDWERRVRARAERLGVNQYGSEAERRIWNILKNEKVQGVYKGTLNDVVGQLSQQTGVNIIFDNIALDDVGVATDRPVNIPMPNAISLESSLNVILGSYGLVFIVEDEVIKVTSRDAQRKDVQRQTYYIGDLVTPIQNFTSGLSMSYMSPNGGSGSNGFLSQSPALSANQAGGGAISPVMAARSNPSAQNPYAMGQNLPGGFGQGGYGVPGGFGGQSNTGQPITNSIGPQTAGGVTAADFDPLIDLIKATIDPEGWDDTNGDGTVQAYVPNLSLIVSQTQEVQDQIQDLLRQLRELNDVQIVVEVKFITLSDSFFEQIGIDFDFALNDNAGDVALGDEVSRSVTVGLDALGAVTANQDIPFSQNSFGAAIPQFGGFDVGTAANFGFAILSDIEVFFLLTASKGDTRTNTTVAPTVTMFNGQSANVADLSVTPFVTSVVPVVADFAVAQQPVITLLPEGTNLNVNAVVSNDRKFVRLTMLPFFSQITNVETFRFTGSTTTSQTSESFLDGLIGTVTGDPDVDDAFDVETVDEGTTIQLPTLATTTISTVVSVPDGGTVLLGGIKTLSEGRTERGVPFLSNIPYVNRLFKNVGIGRDADNLMMMVTPRIIIQSEEEAAQVGNVGRN